MEPLFIIKIGGNVIDNEENLRHFLKSFANLPQKKVLIHGGGKVATDISKGLGIEAKMVDGRRITDAETLKIVTMVYGGLINKQIVSRLQSLGCNAAGFTGADAGIMQAKKRPVKNGIDYGFVGDVEKVNGKQISDFIENGLVPVIAPLTFDIEGNMLNTNADTVASSVAVALASFYQSNLIYCFELKGVLEDINNPASVISEISFEKYLNLKEQGIISKGMIPKMDNSFQAIEKGVHKVIIGHADNLEQLVGDQVKSGTVLTNS